MRIKTLLLALSLATFWSLPATAGVDVDYDNSVDFSQYKTYAWMEGTPVPNELMQRRIEAAIEIGILMVDLVDAGKDELVWREIGSGTLKKPEKMAKKIPKAVGKMFKKFPPE